MILAVEKECARIGVEYALVAQLVPHRGQDEYWADN